VSPERFPTNIIKISNANKKNIVHPTQKPVELMEYLIKTYTNENDLVLDNCMGSGTTVIAAMNTNRQVIGIEMDENYFNIAKERIEDHKVETSK
jgi:site-specific DNA-methyltransferase (adenine-specific)